MYLILTKYYDSYIDSKALTDNPSKDMATTKKPESQSATEKVLVSESIERFSDVKLDDGTVLRMKAIAIEAERLLNQWTPDGDPIYNVKSHTVVMVKEAPASLKREVN